MNAEQASSMVEDNVYHAVLDTIDMCFVWNLEERYARQFAARGARGMDMLRSARKLLADAFRRIADDCERGWDGLDDGGQLRDAYLDAVDAESRGDAS